MLGGEGGGDERCYPLLLILAFLWLVRSDDPKVLQIVTRQLSWQKGCSFNGKISESVEGGMSVVIPLTLLLILAFLWLVRSDNPKVLQIARGQLSRKKGRSFNRLCIERG